MVLQKVGEFQTTINVNGDQKVSTNQSSDKTYNLSESFNTDIQVNGSTEGSFSQTSNSTYNIDINDLTVSDSDYGWIGEGSYRTIANVNTPFSIDKADYEISVGATFPTNSGFGSVYVDGNREVRVTDNDGTKSGTLTGLNANKVRVYSDGDFNYDVTVYISGNFGINTNVSQL